MKLRIVLLTVMASTTFCVGCVSNFPDSVLGATGASSRQPSGAEASDVEGIMSGRRIGATQRLNNFRASTQIRAMPASYAPSRDLGTAVSSGIAK